MFRETFETGEFEPSEAREKQAKRNFEYTYLPGNKKRRGANVVLGSDEAAIQQARNDLEEFYGRESAYREQHEKPAELEEVVEFLNPKLQVFLVRYGLDAPVDITVEDVILPNVEAVKKNTGEDLFAEGKAGGHYFPLHSQIGLYEEDPKILIHEMVHMQSFQSWKSEDNVVSERRMGMAITDKNQDRYYAWLNEAITEELTRRFVIDDLANQEVLYAQEKLGELRKQYKKERLKKKFGLGNKNWDGFAYFEERQKFSQLVRAIYKKNKDMYANEEEVFRLFTEAALNGRLLPLAREIEKTYGKGAFRQLGKEPKK
jgi:hypothetical protein